MRTQIVIPIAIATIIVLLPVTVFGECCTQPDNGTGTVDLPPEGCAYVSAAGDNWEMIDGLPPGTTIEGPGTHGEFFNVVRTPGGTLGGEIETFNSTLMLELYGTGELDGFHRTIFMEVACEVHTGPRNPGDPVQTFSSNMINFYGVISGDPDFDFLIVRAGSNFGLPSPGETTLTQLPSGDFAVDSFFDITYEIDFVGAPGSALDGFVGTTASTVWMEIVFDCYNCTAPDNGSSTIDFPAACPYDNGAENIVVSEGLVPGDTLILDGPLTNFTSIDHKSGSASGGETVFFDAEFPFAVSGTGNLTGYTRNITIPVICEVHTGPRNPGDPVQTFTNDMFRLSGGIVGDPDFDSLSIMAGTGNGLPSPGKTVLKEELPSGDFPADSFFDITYQIEFTGAPGSIFDGLSGTTTGEIRLYTGFECNTYLNEVIDAWATSESRVEFGSPEFSVIPAGFFGPGSDPFEGQVCLKGEPLGESEFGDYDLADTLILRDAHPFDRCDSYETRDPIPVEIVELNLKSCSPIEVTFDPPGVSYYDVGVSLNPAYSSAGLMPIEGNESGGIYSLVIPAYLRFTFTPVGGGTALVYDPATPVTITSLPNNWYGVPQIPTVRPYSGHGELYRDPTEAFNFKPFGDLYSARRSPSNPFRLQLGTDGGYIDITNEDPLPMDLDHDGDVDLSDFAAFADKWLFCE